MADVRIEWDEAAVRRLPETPEALRETEAAAHGIAALAAQMAPTDTSAGRDSIEPFEGEGEAGTFDVSWDKAHYYMVFHDQGTEFLEAKPFLIPAAEAYNHD